MLNIWLKNNCSMKKIKCHTTACVFLRLRYKYELEKVFSLGHNYFSRHKHVPVEFWYTYFTRKVNLTKRENFLTSCVYYKRGNAYAVDIPDSQMLSIGSFGERVYACWKSLHNFDICRFFKINHFKNTFSIT